MTAIRYHHGNLRAALLDSGLKLAAARGVGGLQVRDLAAAEGVSPAAVYRHFPDLAHLSVEVARLAREQLARTMLEAANVVPPCADAGEQAIRRFDAIGRAYVRFAVREPNLFDLAFRPFEASPSCADDPSAWSVLETALDALVEAGELSPALREGAPMVAWSAVHGLASILVRQLLPPSFTVDAAIDVTVLGVQRALGVRASR